MTTFNLESQYLYKLLSLPRGCRSSSSIKNVCNIPSHTLTIDFLSNIFLCDCDGWLPLPIGKVKDFKTIDDIFSHDIAVALQKDVEEQFFSWCAVDHCGIRHENKIKDRLDLLINIDESCNLNCPSCRRTPIMVSQGPEYESKIRDVQMIINWLEQYNKDIHIIISGNGDCLASHIMRPIIKSYIPKPNQTFTIFTNGLLLKKQIDTGVPILDQIVKFKISVDAGSKQIYEDVRRPGKWEVLIENFNYLVSIKKNHLVTLNFALQNKNYQDIPKFVSMCHDFGFQGHIHALDDWGTWSINKDATDVWTIANGTFGDHDVSNKNHPNHQSAKKILIDYFTSDNISFDPMTIKKFNLRPD